MNNIPDDPARVAPPESPKGFSIDEAKFDFLENYLDSDDSNTPFHHALEDVVFGNDYLHAWFRKLYTAKGDEVELDMKDLLKDVVSDYVEANL
jgi:hypothetical protein